MASKSVVDAVNARLLANWTATPIIGVNMQGEPPDDAGPFLTVQYPAANSQHIGMAGVGNRVYREEGIIRLVLSVQRGLGINQGLTWCDQLIALFISQQFGIVTARVPNPPIQHDDNDRGDYYVLSVTVPYYADFFA